MANDDGCGVGECEKAGMWEGRAGVNERDVFKRDAAEETKRFHDNMGSDGDGFGRKEILEEEDMGPMIGEKKFVCGDEAGNEGLFAIENAKRFTGRGGRSQMRKKPKR